MFVARPPSAIYAVSAVLWTGCAACWIVQFFLPLTSTGPLAASSSMETAGLLLSGLFIAVVPAWTASVLLVLPAVGVVMALLSVFGGADTIASLAVCAGLGALCAALVIGRLTSFSVAQFGPGAWTILLGGACAVTALGVATLYPDPSIDGDSA